jgi:hypothetical protein
MAVGFVRSCFLIPDGWLGMPNNDEEQSDDLVELSRIVAVVRLEERLGPSMAS